VDGRTYGRTDGRTDVRTYGRTFFPSILLGRLSEVDLTKKIKYGEKRFSRWRMKFLQVTPCNVACCYGIMTVNSPCGRKPTLQRDRWFWDNMPLNSPKRPPYWNSTSGFDFGHITAVDMSFCTSLRNFI